MQSENNNFNGDLALSLPYCSGFLNLAFSLPKNDYVT